MTGSIIKTAAANLNSQTDQWEVDISFTGKGSSQFNKYAATHYQCYVEDESNPPYCALQAIELDATVESDPAIEAPRSTGCDHKRLDLRPVHRHPGAGPGAGPQLRFSAGALRGPGHQQRIAPDRHRLARCRGHRRRRGRVPGAYLPDHLLPRPGLVVVIGICMSGAFIYAITTLLSATEGLALTLSG